MTDRAEPVEAPRNPRSNHGVNAVALGAGAILAVSLPVIWIVRILDADASIVVVALLVAHFVGGAIAARRWPARVYQASAAAGALAFSVSAGINIVRRVVTGEGVGLATVLTWFVLLQIATSVSMLGAMFQERRK